MVRNTFKSLKQNTKQYKLFLIRRFQEELSMGKGGEHTQTSKNKALVELERVFGSDGNKLSKKMRECRRGNYCSSIYCIECARRISHHLYKRWIESYERGYPLYAITILNGLCKRDEESVRVWIKDIRRRIELCRKSNPHFYIDGWIEIEIINTKILQTYIPVKQQEQYKIKYLRDCMSNMDGNDDYYLLPHIHGVLRGGEVNKKDYNKLFRKYFVNEREVMIKNVGFGKQGVEVGLQTWANYVMKVSTIKNNYRKDLYTFKTTFQSNNPIPDDYEITSFRIPEIIIGGLMMLSDKIKGDNNKGLIVRSGKR